MRNLLGNRFFRVSMILATAGLLVFLAATLTLLGPPKPHHNSISRDQRTAIRPIQSSNRPGTVDGSQHPELIPGDRAVHMALLAASASAAGNTTGQNRAAAVVKQLGLQPTDAEVLSGVAQG